MEIIFNLPKDQAANAYNLITSQVRQNYPLNVGLILDKYVNKYVTGYLDQKNWQKGKQSEIKRQIYLLRKERVKILEKLKQMRDLKGKTTVTFREGKRVQRKRLEEILNPIIGLLEDCNIDDAINKLSSIVKKIQDRNVSEELGRNLEKLSKVKLGLPLFVVDNNLYQAFCNRMKFVLDKLKTLKYVVKEEILGVNWRLIINLGAASVYETSLLFHRNYSVPYIPGSAVKGVARHWAIQKFAEEYQKPREVSYEIAIKEVDKALENGKDLRIKVKDEIAFEDVIKIFGTQKRKGEVIFFDALPVLDGVDKSKDFVVLDVINTHYRDYYQDEIGKTPPGDWMNPTPIFFLAVEKGTKFRFAVASKDENLAEKAMELLKEAVRKIGIGAKTSAGYGYFEV